MTLRNNITLLKKLHEEGLIDYSSPLWIDLSHHDKRVFMPFEDFEEQLVEINSKYYFVPTNPTDPIPVTEIVLPISVDGRSTDHVSFVATVRPLTELEVDPFYKGSLTKKSSKQELFDLERRAMDLPNSDVFHPHLIGPSQQKKGDTILLFPFDAFDENKSNLMDIVHEALDFEGYNYIHPRDSNINIKNRMKYGLDNFIISGYVHAKKGLAKMTSGPLFREVSKLMFDALVIHKFNSLPLRKVHYSDLVRLINKDVTEPIVSYYPLTIRDFGKEFYNVPYTQTFPVFLSNHNPYTAHKGLFNFGMLEKYAPNKQFAKDDPGHAVDLDFASSAHVAFWADKKFAKLTSSLISNYLKVAVTPVSYEKPTQKNPRGKLIFHPTVT